MEQTLPLDDARPIAAPTRIEWPTIVVAVLIYSLFIIAVVTHRQLPAPITIVLLAVAGAWYGSLQHEVIHGHPTPWRLVNCAMVVAPLSLLVRFGNYHDSHLSHHVDANLTDPLADPESSYITAAQWDRAGGLKRVCRLAQRTLLGTMLIRPPMTIGHRIRDIGVALRGPGRWIELRSLLAVISILAVVQRTGLPLWQYAVGAGYLAHSLTAVRSFAEHRAVAGGASTAVVRAGLFWRLLFLNNSLHITHHARPGVAWYLLPAEHERLGLEAEAARGAGVYRGYREVFGRYLLRPFCQVVHPGS